MDSSSTISELPPELAKYLANFESRRRLVFGLRALGLSAALALAWLLVCSLMDRILALPASARIVLLAVGGIVAIFPPAILLIRLRRPIDWTAVAARIESRDSSFGQRLETVASQLLWPSQYRGSRGILDQLARETISLTQTRRAGGLVSWKPAIKPWIAAAALAVVTLAIWNIAYLDLPSLFRRIIEPTAHHPPVTMTRLDVETGSIAVLQGRPLTIGAIASRFGQRSPALYLSGDGRDFSPIEMTPRIGLGQEKYYEFTLAAVDRDLRYYVRAGDAASEIYDIRVKRIPAIEEFEISYTYPASVLSPPRTVVNTDGHIEAPAGSTARIRVHVTEPLATGFLLAGDQKIALVPSGDNRYQAILPVDRDMNCTVRMTTPQGVESNSVVLSVHAIPDHPPIARLIQPAQDLMLDPLAIVAVRYEAVDDHAIAAMSLRIQQYPGETSIPIHVPGNLARAEGTLRLDLGTYNLHPGDVIGLSVVAEDSAHQESSTGSPRRILIVPHGTDQAAHRRLAEIKNAADLAAAWATELEHAKSAWEDVLAVNIESPIRQAARLKARHACADAADTAIDLHLALLRALSENQLASLPEQIADSEFHQVDSHTASPDYFPSLGMGLSGLTDKMMQISADLSASEDAEAPAPLALSPSQAAAIARQLHIFHQGLAAGEILIQRDDFKQLDASPPPHASGERYRSAMADARQAMAFLLGELNLLPTAPDLEESLWQRIRAARSAADGIDSADWIVILRQWDPVNDPEAAAALPQRLDSAAETQSLTAITAAQFAWARDLHLAARAAAALTGPGIATSDLRTRAARLPILLEKLYRDDFAPQSSGAEALRRELAGYAMQGEPPSSGSLSIRHIGTLTLEANAATAMRQPDRATLDGRFLDAIAAAAPDEAARLKQNLDRLNDELDDLDRLISTQEALYRQTKSAKPGQIASLTSRQRALADGLEADPPRQAVFISPVKPTPALTAELTGRYPQAAAKAYSQAAADALAHDPPDTTAAQDAQFHATIALRCLSHLTLVRIAQSRMEAAPSFAAIFASPAEGRMASALATSLLRRYPTSRRSAAMSLDNEPAAYQDALRSYFDALAHGLDDKGNGKK